MRFWLRYWFHMFWAWLSYFARIDLQAHAWFRRCTRELDAAMREHLAA